MRLAARCSVELNKQRAIAQNIKQQWLRQVCSVDSSCHQLSPYNLGLTWAHRCACCCYTAHWVRDRVSAGLSKSPIWIQDKQQQTIKTTKGVLLVWGCCLKCWWVNETWSGKSMWRKNVRHLRGLSDAKTCTTVFNTKERIVATVFCFFLTITRKTTTVYWWPRQLDILRHKKKHIQIAKIETHLENMLIYLTM